jgi:hypothetical protein
MPTVTISENGVRVASGRLDLADPFALRIAVVLDNAAFAMRLFGRSYRLQIAGASTYDGCQASSVHDDVVTFLAMRVLR